MQARRKRRRKRTAIVAINALTLVLIGLSWMICFSDVARAPPPTAAMTECLVTAGAHRACACRDDDIHP